MEHGPYGSLPMREVKLCLLGESGVGKTSIVNRFVRDSFKSAQEMTIGASFLSKKIEVDGRTYQFHIWDTAGQEKYRALAPMYYRGSAGAIIVYDITRAETFTSVKDWVSELQKNAPSNIVLAIAGNKCDLDDFREIHKNDIDEYAKQINAQFIETSALTAVNVSDLFKEIARNLPPEENNSNMYARSNSRIDLHRNKNKQQQQKKCCGNS